MRRRTEDLTLSYPAGVRALLPDDVRRRRRVENAIVATLEARSFDEIVVPIIDFVDPFCGISDREAQRRSYRFVDRNGELIAIRSDFTPMVARALAPSLGRAALPLRVFYRGDVVRCEATRLGAQRELFQIGAELIGDDSPSADATMLTLALELVANAGIAPTAVLTNTAIANQLISSSSASRATRTALRSALAHKRSTAIADLDDLSPERIELVRLIISGRATLDDFRALPETRDAANELAVLQQRVVEATGANVVLALDDIDEEPGYYTGIRFRIFDPRTRLRLAQGGRYDDLYARFGVPARAIGFTLTVDDLDGESR